METVTQYSNYILVGVLAISMLVFAFIKGVWGSLSKGFAIFVGMLAGFCFLPYAAGYAEKYISTGAQAASFAVVAILASLAFVAVTDQGKKIERCFKNKGTDVGLGLGVALLTGIIGAILAWKTVPFLDCESWEIDETFQQLYPGGIVRFVALAVFFALWIFPTKWGMIDINLQKKKMGEGWKYVLLLPFPILSAIAFTILPRFTGGGVVGIILGILLPLLGLALPLLIYLLPRDAKNPKEEKVLTSDNLKKLFGKKVKKKKKTDEVEWLLPIELFPHGNGVTKAVKNELCAAAKELPHCKELAEALYRALKRKATGMRLEQTGTATVTYYFQDGIWQQIPAQYAKPISQEHFPGVMVALKTLLRIDPERVFQRFSGELYMEYDNVGGKKKKMAAQILAGPKGNTQGAPAPESIQVQFLPVKHPIETFEQLGMSTPRIEQVKKLLATPKGLVLFAAAPGHGLRTLTNVMMLNADRFTRDFISVEDEAHLYADLENVVRATYDSRKGETPDSILTDVFFKEPAVLLIRDFVNKESLTHCCQEIENDRLVFTTIRARNSAEAILRLLATGIDPKLLADSLTTVVSQRLVRVLCPFCKDMVPINPEKARPLGISPQQVDTFYAPHVSNPTSQNGTLCPECLGVGFKTRMGIYDILTINDEIRHILATRPSEKAIREAAMKSKEYGFVEDASLLISWGVTSPEEYARALQS